MKFVNSFQHGYWAEPRENGDFEANFSEIDYLPIFLFHAFQKEIGLDEDQTEGKGNLVESFISRWEEQLVQLLIFTWFSRAFLPPSLPPRKALEISKPCKNCSQGSCSNFSFPLVYPCVSI